MRHPIRIIILFLLAGTFACTSGRQLTQINDQAREAYAAGEYQQALERYEQLIQAARENSEPVGGEVYNKAGLSAWALDNTSKALEYLEAARHTEAANAQTFAALAKGYRQVDNLSREITNLERYLEKYPEGEEREAFKQRLFMTYVESMNYDQALALWPTLDPAAREQEELLEGYFLVHKNLGNDTQVTEIAQELLKKNKNNVNALEWLAELYYWRAENRYQAENKAYEKNRTRRQYAKLLKAYEVLNTDFRISLNYFLRLYELDPQPSVARYIGNIYLRFQEKEKADYYHRKAKQ